MLFFRLLETKKSEANEKKLFSTKYTIYVPDFFIVFFFASLISFCCLLDLILAVFMFISNTSLVLAIVFLVTAYLRIIFEIIVENKSSKSFSEKKKEIFGLFLGILYVILGLHSITFSTKILKKNLKFSDTSNQPSGCFTYPIFHISDEHLSLLKIYCYIHLAFRCIPQLFVVSVFIELNHSTGIYAYLSTANLVLNMVFFGFTISITLPIRKTPRIYTNFSCLLLSAINKFLATTSGVCANLLIFTTTFKKAEHYAFLAHFLKTIIWLFPCQSLLSAQPIRLSPIQFITYLIFFPLVFSFIFVHPFESTWRLCYYFSYLLTGLMDLAFLSLWADATIEDLTYLCILKCVQVGFLSCFGLVNSIRKGSPCVFREEVNENRNIVEVVEDVGEAGGSKMTKVEDSEEVKSST